MATETMSQKERPTGELPVGRKERGAMIAAAPVYTIEGESVNG